jgi:hypothetical protein
MLEKLDDQSSFLMGVNLQEGKICLDFGKLVQCIGFYPDQAVALADALLEKVQKIREFECPSVEQKGGLLS